MIEICIFLVVVMRVLCIICVVIGFIVVELFEFICFFFWFCLR